LDAVIWVQQGKERLALANKARLASAKGSPGSPVYLSPSNNDLIGSVQSFHRATSLAPSANCHNDSSPHPDPGSSRPARTDRAPFLGVLQIRHSLVTEGYSDYISPGHRRGVDATHVYYGGFRRRS
jgi:hypothetical protein